jgi:hypothetical protein
MPAPEKRLQVLERLLVASERRSGGFVFCGMHAGVAADDAGERTMHPTHERIPQKVVVRALNALNH